MENSYHNMQNLYSSFLDILDNIYFVCRYGCGKYELVEAIYVKKSL